MSILAVMVRYNTPLAQSDTANGVRDALASNPILREKYRFLLWDNSPKRLMDSDVPTAFEYRHSRHNLGISGACNGALQLAREQRHAWMLLLDQDTHVTASFLETMLRWSMDLALRREIAIAAPTVRVGDKIVSPRQHLFNSHLGTTQKSCLRRILKCCKELLHVGSFLRMEFPPLRRRQPDLRGNWRQPLVGVVNP